MSSVLFTTTRGSVPSITICSAAEYPKLFVALGNHLQGVTTEVHYVESLRRSVPHLQENCQHCHLPMMCKTWIPAAICPLTFGRSVMEMTRLPLVDSARRAVNTWQRKVVELPPSAMMMAVKLERGQLFAIVRGQGREYKKVYGKIFPGVLIDVPDTFDVKPHLLKVWGMGHTPLTRL